MANDRLRSALAHHGLTVEGVARLTDVDPKTAQRWVSGRVPHPRHRWRIAAELDEDEEFLWPSARRPQAEGATAAAELVAAYSYRTDVDPNQWWRLITTATKQIDLLGYTLYFLPHQHPQLISVLKAKCEAGCKGRLIMADPDSDQVRRRDEEEREAITLVARIASSMKEFAPLLECTGADLRYQDAPLYNSVFRFDDEMFVTPHLYATPGRAAPLLHLRRLGPNGMFSRFAAHFEGLWADSSQVGQDRLCPPVRAGG
jgi:transcriptional regulator with XRE-family HTH domain